MSALEAAEEMLSLVAKALGPELLDSVAFVGDRTTGFHLSDRLAAQNVRFTDDVDLIVDVVGRIEWYQFQSTLRDLGFTESPLDDVTCRMRLGELKVDFMPDDKKKFLGFRIPGTTMDFEPLLITR